jgi:hypothetical protein
MKLIMHTSIFSVVFAGILASALTTKPTAQVPVSRGLAVSYSMPVPNCDPATGCPNVASYAMPVPNCDPATGCPN